MFKIINAEKAQASEIASLIMMAMDYDCCQHFAGEHHSLDDFHQMMTHLVQRTDSQYSYKNTLVAVTSKRDIAGCLTAYDGADLRRLRQAFVQAAREELGRDFSHMDDETTAGEFYLDSLAVKEQYRHHGIATALLREVIRREVSRQPVGLLVDLTHPWAERLYVALGFRFVNNAEWGGHQMKHLQFPCKCGWALSDPLLERYHDEEWGVPVHDERKHFELLLMESMSCGLSWLMMLKRREVFRKCFAQFDPKAVAAFTSADVDRIMATEGMIRSRRKIEGIIGNARAFVSIEEEWGSFDRYIWHFTNGQTRIYPDHQQHSCVRNELSDEVANDLKKRGFKYVGTVIIYSHLQAIGIINDHMATCFRYKAVSDGNSH